MIDVTVLGPRRGKDDEEFGLFPRRVCFFFDPKFPFKYFKFSRRVWGVGQLRTLRLLDFTHAAAAAAAAADSVQRDDSRQQNLALK
jgi:hypothetical protein